MSSKMHFFVLKIWSNQKNSRRFLQKADYNYTAGLWECLSLLPEHRTSQCTSLSQDPLLGFKHGESRSYFPKKGMEASFSLPIKCMERSLKRANSCSNHKNERKYRKKDYILENTIRRRFDIPNSSFLPIHVSPCFLL